MPDTWTPEPVGAWSLERSGWHLGCGHGVAGDVEEVGRGNPSPSELCIARPAPLTVLLGKL